MLRTKKLKKKLGIFVRCLAIWPLKSNLPASHGICKDSLGMFAQKVGGEVNIQTFLLKEGSEDVVLRRDINTRERKVVLIPEWAIRSRTWELFCRLTGQNNFAKLKDLDTPSGN